MEPSIENLQGYRYDTSDPPRMAGNKVLLEDTLANLRRAWSYIPVSAASSWRPISPTTRLRRNPAAP